MSAVRPQWPGCASRPWGYRPQGTAVTWTRAPHLAGTCVRPQRLQMFFGGNGVGQVHPRPSAAFPGCPGDRPRFLLLAGRRSRHKSQGQRTDTNVCVDGFTTRILSGWPEAQVCWHLQLSHRPSEPRSRSASPHTPRPPVWFLGSLFLLPSAAATAAGPHGHCLGLGLSASPCSGRRMALAVAGLTSVLPSAERAYHRLTPSEGSTRTRAGGLHGVSEAPAPRRPSTTSTRTHDPQDPAELQPGLRSAQDPCRHRPGQLPHRRPVAAATGPRRRAATEPRVLPKAPQRAGARRGVKG